MFIWIWKMFIKVIQICFQSYDDKTFAMEYFIKPVSWSGISLHRRYIYMYLYFADDKSKREKTDLKILLVRLLIGNPFVSGQCKNYKHPPCSTCKTTDCINAEHVNYDSIIVEGTWMFREFVVYESNHCYPEYIITYDRV